MSDRLRDEVAETVYRELGNMVNRDYLIDALLPLIEARIEAATAQAMGDVERLLGDARRDALTEAADALNVEGVGFRPGWGSGNPVDQGALEALGKSIQWLRDRAGTP